MKRFLRVLMALLGASCGPAPIDETQFAGSWRFPGTGETEVPPNCSGRNVCRGYVLGLSPGHTFTMTMTLKNDAGCVQDSLTTRGTWSTRYVDGIPSMFLQYPAELDCAAAVPGPCVTLEFRSCAGYPPREFRVIRAELVDFGGGAAGTERFVRAF